LLEKHSISLLVKKVAQVVTLATHTEMKTAEAEDHSSYAMTILLTLLLAAAAAELRLRMALPVGAMSI
jgi:hypothetical protein